MKYAIEATRRSSQNSRRDRSYPKPPKPKDEPERLKALVDLKILDTDPESGFDRIALLAKTLFKVKVCAVSLVDEDRQWFKAIAGVCLPQEMPRDHAFCAYTILGESPLLVQDTAQDSRFRDNPLVTGPPGIRFYAGVALNTREGSKIGALCLIDTKPRHKWSQMRSAVLSELAQMVCRELEMHSLRKRVEQLSIENETIIA